MPIYEYACKTCGETIEVLQRHGDPSPSSCGEDCVRTDGPVGGGKLERVLSVTGGYSMGRSRSAPPAPASACGACQVPEGSCELRDG